MRLLKSARADLSEIGRRGGKKGGRVRTAAPPSKQRTEAARKAVQARWARRRTPGGAR